MKNLGGFLKMTGTQSRLFLRWDKNEEVLKCFDF